MCGTSATTSCSSPGCPPRRPGAPRRRRRPGTGPARRESPAAAARRRGAAGQPGCSRRCSPALAASTATGASTCAPTPFPGTPGWPGRCTSRTAPPQARGWDAAARDRQPHAGHAPGRLHRRRTDPGLRLPPVLRSEATPSAGPPRSWTRWASWPTTGPPPSTPGWPPSSTASPPASAPKPALGTRLHDGAPRTPALNNKSVRIYLTSLRPALLAWSGRYGHLREVTRDDVRCHLDALHGHRAKRPWPRSGRCSPGRRRTASSSATRPPTCPPAGANARSSSHCLPRQLSRAVQAATTPHARLFVALAAVHAARPAQIRALQLTDADLGNRRLTIAGQTRPLDDLTLRVLPAG